MIKSRPLSNEEEYSYPDSPVAKTATFVKSAKKALKYSISYARRIGEVIQCGPLRKGTEPGEIIHSIRKERRKEAHKRGRNAIAKTEMIS